MNKDNLPLSSPSNQPFSTLSYPGLVIKSLYEDDFLLSYKINLIFLCAAPGVVLKTRGKRNLDIPFRLFHVTTFNRYTNNTNSSRREEIPAHTHFHSTILIWVGMLNVLLNPLTPSVGYIENQRTEDPTKKQRKNRENKEQQEKLQALKG